VKPVLLWSDVLIFFLLIAVVYLIFGFKKSDRTLSNWRKVFESKVGMVTFVILFFYISLAVLDSLHFRKVLPPVNDNPTIYYGTHVYSKLDLLLGEMGENIERTYSAPFALKSFIRENRSTPLGVVRDFQPLKHAGRHLEKGGSQKNDILTRSYKSVLKGGMVCFIFITAHILWLKLKTQKHSKVLSPLPWNYAYVTLSILVILLVWLIDIGNAYHVFGTDQAGNDTLYKALKSIRTGVLLGTLATLIMMPIAIGLGLSAGYFKGWVDDFIQYLYTTLSSIPGILLIAASALLFQVFIDNNPGVFGVEYEKADVKFLGLCFILGVTSWASLCRILRAETLKISQLDYVQAAHAFGVSHFRIICKHILPNITPIILITFIMDFSGLVLAEAVLSYIGVGIDPAMASWGNMINMARTELSREPAIWWNLIAALSFMFVLVLASNLFSDLINDAFNPKAKINT